VNDHGEQTVRIVMDNSDGSDSEAGFFSGSEDESVALKHEPINQKKWDSAQVRHGGTSTGTQSYDFDLQRQRCKKLQRN
jgi:hypothetical protein